MLPLSLAITLSFLGALAAGSLGAIAGIGGGIIIVPLLNQVVGVDIKHAIGTSLAATIATSCIGSSVYLRKGITNLRLAFFLEPTAIIGSVTGATLVGVLEPRLLKLLFAIALLYTALTMIKGKKVREANLIPEDDYGKSFLDGNYYDEYYKKVFYYRPLNKIPALILNTGAGIVSGMLGLGGGIVKVPIMNLLMRVPIKVASATSNFMIGFTAASGTIIHLKLGNVEPMLVAAVVLGIYIGSLYAAKRMVGLNPTFIRLIFAILLILSALKMMLS